MKDNTLSQFDLDSDTKISLFILAIFIIGSFALGLFTNDNHWIPTGKILCEPIAFIESIDENSSYKYSVTTTEETVIRSDDLPEQDQEEICYQYQQHDWFHNTTQIRFTEYR